MKPFFASLFTKLTLAASVAGALVGCDEPTYPTPTPAIASTVGQARVLVVNAAPGTQGVTTTLDNVAFGMTLPYLGTSTSGSYTAIPAGQRLFIYNDPANIPATPTVTPTPTPPPPVVTTARPVVARTSFLGGTNYTIFLTDAPTRAYAFPVTATSDQGGIRTVTLTDNLTTPAVGRTRVRFVNLSPSLTASGAGGFGLFNTVANAFLFDPTGRGYRATSYTVPMTTPPQTTNFANFTDLAAGDYTVDVRTTATTTPRIAPQVLTFASGKIYTVYTRGVANNMTTPLGISVVTHN